jgi:hypothetical protein
MRTRRWVCSASNGHAILDIPENLSEFDAQDIVDWLELAKRQVARELEKLKLPPVKICVEMDVWESKEKE